MRVGREKGIRLLTNGLVQGIGKPEKTMRFPQKQNANDQTT